MRLVNNTNLKSERNICFINTALQLLHSVPRMKRFFQMREYRLSTEGKKKMQICDEIARIFSSDGSLSSTAAELRRLVATKSGRNYLNDGTQQDTVEFLTILLQEVEEEISVNNWEAKVVIQEFWGTEKKEKRFVNRTGICSKCKSSPRDEVERFQVLQLDIPNTSRVISLNGVIETYFSESSDDAKMKCSCCTHKSNCPETGVCKPKGFVSKRVLVNSPDILVVQINRYLDLSGSKIKTTVWPNDKIMLPSGDEYTLCGIGHHLGDTFKGGHYIASVKLDNEWTVYNDTESLRSDESDSKSMECNVCIYSKVFGPSTPFIPTDEWQDLKGRQAPGGLHYSFGLKGNYARNMNLGDNLSFKKQVSPNKSPKAAANQQKDGTEDEVQSTEKIEDGSWTTPKKRKDFLEKTAIIRVQNLTQLVKLELCQIAVLKKCANHVEKDLSYFSPI